MQAKDVKTGQRFRHKQWPGLLLLRVVPTFCMPATRVEHNPTPALVLTHAAELAPVFAVAGASLISLSPDTEVDLYSSDYLVRWEIELEAADARHACELADDIMRDPDSDALTFTVFEPDGCTGAVNLLDEDT